MDNIGESIVLVLDFKSLLAVSAHSMTSIYRQTFSGCYLEALVDFSHGRILTVDG